MSSKAKKQKKKVVSQVDLRKMMNEMKNKRETNNVAKTTKQTRRLLNPDVLQIALKDRMKLQKAGMLEGGDREMSTKREAGNLDAAKGHDGPEAKVAKFQKKRKEAPGGSLVGGYDSAGSSSEEEKVVKKPTESSAGAGGKPDESSSLPEGFFDNPETDAKMRGVETPSNAMDREWEEFQKVIQHESGQSEQIIEDDHKQENILRQIEEIDEQIHFYSRVEKLNETSDVIKQKPKLKIVKKDKSDDQSDDDLEIDESLLDWREKDAFI